jgi:endogenous inhibitor of DNA gyrase (YacG/DUF329 family)
MVKVVEKAKGQRWMYQGNLVQIVELNGCLARVKVVDEPSTRSFCVGRDELVDLRDWRALVTSQEVEAPADLVRQVDLLLRAREVYGRPIQGMKVNVMEPGRTIR